LGELRPEIRVRPKLAGEGFREGLGISGYLPGKYAQTERTAWKISLPTEGIWSRFENIETRVVAGENDNPQNVVAATDRGGL
jgi:hypothetical protein